MPPAFSIFFPTTAESKYSGFVAYTFNVQPFVTSNGSMYTAEWESGLLPFSV